MMFRRYHHGHSAGMGFLLALSLHAHMLWLATAALLLGVVIGRAWGFWADAGLAIKARLLGAKQERISTVPVPVYSTRPSGAQDRDGVPY